MDSLLGMKNGFIEYILLLLIELRVFFLILLLLINLIQMMQIFDDTAQNHKRKKSETPRIAD